MTQKVRGGGTVSRAPLGYRNIRTTDSEGREVRTVVVDEERAPLIQQAFALYATGEWTIAALAEHLADRGLTTLATPRIPSKPIDAGKLNKLLVNPYYKGVVTFKGATHPGKHAAAHRRADLAERARHARRPHERRTHPRPSALPEGHRLLRNLRIAAARADIQVPLRRALPVLHVRGAAQQAHRLSAEGGSHRRGRGAHRGALRAHRSGP